MKKIIPIVFLLSTVAFLIYCFLPVINYDTRYSQHVNHTPNQSLAPGRIFLTDRNGEVITDKMYSNGYYKWIDTSECFTSYSTQSQLPLNSVYSSLPLDEGEQTESSSVLRTSPSMKKVPPSRGGENYEEKVGGVVAGEKSPCEFINALVQIEDKNFYSHWGVNLPAKLRAIKDNLSGKKVSGGSTITEQYVKNKYFKNTKRSYLQKAREAVIALYITISSPSMRGMSEGQGELSGKEHILNIYYHDAYFGNRLYGVGAALEVYFGKEKLTQLTQEEIVILLSLLHNPGTSSLDEKYFRKYFDQVKTRLGYDFDRTYTGKLPQKENIDRFPFVTLHYEKLPLNHLHNSLPLNEGEQTESPSSRDQGELSFAQERDALGQMSEEGGQRELGIKVSIDARLQGFARETLQQTLKELADKNVTNGAIFAMNPKTGEVLIYQGSKDFSAKDIDGQVNVIEALRQPGSTMKPFLYLMALESGANPDDLVLDIESEYNSFKEGSVYISENYSLKEYGLVRLKKALGNSFNNATVRLARELGLGEVYEFYKNYGFQLPYPAEHYGYSLVLGNPSISLEQLVESYALLLPEITPPPADAGIPLIEGEQIKSPSSREMSEEGGQRELRNRENIKQQSKFLLYDILSDPDNRDISFGVNSILNTSIPQAVKTGTSSDFRDNLVVSYHPDFVIGVWVGNNDNSSMQGVTGITGAGYIWHQVVEKAIELGYIREHILQVPPGVEPASYCLDTNCYRKENIYKRQGKEYFSRIAEKKYNSEDIFEKLGSYEINRLRELGVEVQ